MKGATLIPQLNGKTLFVFTLLLTLLTPLPIHAQETVTLPALTGEYAVGQTDLYLVDPSRPEIFTDDPADVREVMTTVYYPADVTGDAQPAAYGNDQLNTSASAWPGIDPEGWSLIETATFADVPFAADQPTYPVILFSPGLGTLPVFHSTMLAEIASHGYVVISMSRTYTTALTVFPDGRAVSSNDAGTDVDGREGDTFFDAQERRNRVNAVWVDDIRFVIDQLETLNQDDALLGGHLDLTRIGVVGHSFGGSASAQAAYLDSRIGAVITMDSWLDGEVALEGVSQPYLFMEPANPDYEDPAQTPTDEELAQVGLTSGDLDMLRLRAGHMRLLEQSSAGYRLRLQGISHINFVTDLGIFATTVPGWVRMANLGSIDGERALQLISQYAVAFFDQHLKGQDSSLLNGTTSEYQEVLFEAF